MIQYDKFQKSLKHLEQQLINYKLKENNQNIELIDKEAIAESVIQRFEVCYDCLWKVLKRYLTEELGIPDIPNNPKAIFRIANENEIFESDIKKWFSYAHARIDTTHNYSETKAYQELTLINDFILDAIQVYELMTSKSWE